MTNSLDALWVVARRARLVVALWAAIVGALAFSACMSANGTGHGANGGNGGGGAWSGTGGSINLSIGNGGNGGDGGALVSALVFQPASAAIVVDTSAPIPTASFTLMATLPGGRKQAVTASSLAFDRPDLGTVTNTNPVVFTPSGTLGGIGKIHAIYGGREAVASIQVKVVQRDLGTVTTTVAGALDATTTTGAGDASTSAVTPNDSALTSLLYPYDKTVFPLGLTSPLLMWTAPSGSGDTVRVHLEVANYAYDAYAPVTTTSAQLRIPQKAWDAVTASSTGPSDPLRLVLSRYDGSSKKAYVSVTETWTIAPESLQGAIYYWTASQDASNTRIGAIVKIQPGSGSAPVKLYNGKCMGCHSVSADGTMLAASVDDPTATTADPYTNGWNTTRALGIFPLPSGTPTITNRYGGNTALTPDGKFVVYGGPANASPPPAGAKYLELANTATGALIPTSGLDNLVPASGGISFQMPAFSPDGKKLAVVEAGDQSGNDGPDNVLATHVKSIAYVGFDATKPAFDPTVHPVVLATQMAAGNQGLGYPAFTPDSTWIAFHTGPWSTGCHDGCADSAPDQGEIWMAPVANAAPVRLDKLNDPPATADRYVHREPTFNPAVRGGYSWVVFTSMRDWGNKSEVSGSPTNGKRRLWVAAIDSKLGTTDPSHPAFYLEGQDNTSPNMRGFWVNAACIKTPKAGGQSDACTAGFQCCSGFCVDGGCVDQTTVACAGAGDKCSTSSDCCNAGATTCVGGVCDVVHIK